MEGGFAHRPDGADFPSDCVRLRFRVRILPGDFVGADLDAGGEIRREGTCLEPQGMVPFGERFARNFNFNELATGEEEGKQAG